LVRKRLKDVVNCMPLERRNGMLLMCRDENDGRKRFAPLVELVSKLDAGQFRHPDVQEENLVGLVLHQFQRFHRVLGRVEGFDVGPVLERMRERAPRERFIIHNQHIHPSNLTPPWKLKRLPLGLDSCWSPSQEAEGLPSPHGQRKDQRKRWPPQNRGTSTAPLYSTGPAPFRSLLC